MSIFDDIIGKNADDRLAEEMLYAEAMREIEQGIRREGLWGKALADGAVIPSVIGTIKKIASSALLKRFSQTETM